jgi:DNA-binding cell septation regulator SpoVG
MPRINIEDIGRGTKGHILASCRVTLSTEDGNETITIFDARVLRNRSGELWVGFPTQNVRDFEGMKFLPILDFSRDLRHRISDAVLAAYEKYVAAPDCPAVPAVRGVPYKRIEAADVRASYQFTGSGINSSIKRNDNDGRAREAAVKNVR